MSRLIKAALKEKKTGHALSPGWTFLTNHAHVLLCLSGQPDTTLREVAERVGITERAVQRVVADLEEAGAIIRQRTGRRNHYIISRKVPLRHPIESHRQVGEFIDFVLDK